MKADVFWPDGFAGRFQISLKGKWRNPGSMGSKPILILSCPVADIIAFSVFVAIKLIGALRRKSEEAPAAPAPSLLERPYPVAEIPNLTAAFPSPT